jgi:hypothetical protein
VLVRQKLGLEIVALGCLLFYNSRSSDCSSMEMAMSALRESLFLLESWLQNSLFPA